jgi:hypothetical protein
MLNIATNRLRDLLVSALPSSFDADTAPPPASRLFTPDSHRRALEPDVTVVRGARGVGKTVWFASLQEPSLRKLAAKTYRLPVLSGGIQVSAGFGSLLSAESYPVPGRLLQLLSNFDAQSIWRAVVLNSLSEASITNLATWDERVSTLHRDEALFDEALARADSNLRRDKSLHLILFDALDRMSNSASETDELVEGLLRVALDVRLKSRAIRIKIFSRLDILERSLRFTDASKIMANAVDLTWSDTNLFGLLFTALGNADPKLSPEFRDNTGTWEEIDVDIWRNGILAADGTAQQRLFAEIAGEYMGANHRRGRSYTWLPNHLADGRGQVSPRSFLSAIRHAVDDTRSGRYDHRFPLHWDSIRKGVQKASSIRVAEISEDVPWVESAIKPLMGMQVPMPLDALFRAWETASLKANLQSLTQDTDDRQPRLGPREIDDWPSLLEELRVLGVTTTRSDGRVDLPDVYRVAFGLGRRGGVPRTER